MELSSGFMSVISRYKQWNKELWYVCDVSILHDLNLSDLLINRSGELSSKISFAYPVKPISNVPSNLLAYRTFIRTTSSLSRFPFYHESISGA